MIFYTSRYLTDPPHLDSELLASHIHPPSSRAFVIDGLQQPL